MDHTATHLIEVYVCVQAHTSNVTHKERDIQIYTVHPWSTRVYMHMFSFMSMPMQA